MSNIYIQEPPTEGKVLLVTTVGEIEIELWSRECPKACRNFVQLCMENYYNKTKFHRVVKDFIVQGGDPTGTGNGGESIYGKPFKDEFHSRLRFCRRGLVAMANAGKDDNGSQFFFTLGPTQELQNKHTCFGKVVGDTIYNMLKLTEGAVDEDDRPRNPNKILKTKVLNNPFPDIEPRKVIEMIKEDKKDKRPKSNMRATKNFGLLSFGDEAEEDEMEMIEASKSFKKKGKSSHDLLKDPKLSNEVGDELIINAGESGDEEALEDDKVDGDDSKVDISSLKDKLKKNKDKKKAKVKADSDDEDVIEDEELKEQEKKRDAIKKEIKALQKEIKGGKKRKKGEDEEEEEVEKKEEITEEEKNNDMLREFHSEKAKYAKKEKVPKKGSAREAMTMKLLAKFKNKLHSVKETADENPKEKAAEEDEGEEDVGDDWMANTLKFESNDPVLARDASTKDDDWFDIYDPRNPMNKRRREKDSKNKKR